VFHTLPSLKFIWPLLGTGGQEFSVYYSLLGKGCSKSFCSDLQTFHKGHSWGLSWIMMNMEYRRVYQQCHSGGPFSKKFTTDLWKSLTYEKRRMSMWFSKKSYKNLMQNLGRSSAKLMINLWRHYRVTISEECFRRMTYYFLKKILGSRISLTYKRLMKILRQT